MDSAYPDGYMGNWKYILDNKEFSSLNAIHYLREIGYNAPDALTYMRLLRESKKEG